MWEGPSVEKMDFGSVLKITLMEILHSQRNT